MKKSIWALLLCLLLGLAGCEWNGSSCCYEICYPSGYSRDCYTWDDTVPVEGTGYFLHQEKTEESGCLQIQDEAGRVLAELPGIGGQTVRGEGARDGTLWICSESWETPHYNGYRVGRLRESTLLLADVRTGEILFSRQLDEHQLYLTTRNGRCYFYQPGEESRKKWFGLVRTPAQNASVYARTPENWDEAQTVCELDYIGWPEEPEGQWTEKRVQFSLQENRIDLLLLGKGQEATEVISRAEIPLD